MRQNNADELERFKNDADLPDIAAAMGFQVDTKASDRHHTVLRHQDGTKIITGVNAATGHWCFSSNSGNSGSAIDLVQWREGLNLGEVRRRLRPFIGEQPNRQPIAAWKPKAKPPATQIDRMKGKVEWEAVDDTVTPVFLTKSRDLAFETVQDARFKGTFRTDERHNVVFPYRDKTMAIVAVERRNKPPEPGKPSFRRYTEGGAPGVWLSNIAPTDSRLVIVESPIDAMAAWELMPASERAATRFAAIRRGTPDEDIRAVIAAMPPGSEIIAACDNDPAGKDYNALVKAATPPDRTFTEVVPKTDWNADLMASKEAERQRQAELARQRAAAERRLSWTPSGPGM